MVKASKKHHIRKIEFSFGKSVVGGFSLNGLIRVSKRREMKTERLASPCEHSSGVGRRVGFINSKRVRILSFAEMKMKIDCYMVFRKIFETYLRKHSSSGGGGGQKMTASLNVLRPYAYACEHKREHRFLNLVIYEIMKLECRTS